MSAAQWEELLKNNKWNNVSLRDARYDQVIHLVSEKSFIDQFAFMQSEPEKVTTPQEKNSSLQQMRFSEIHTPPAAPLKKIHNSEFKI